MDGRLVPSKSKKDPSNKKVCGAICEGTGRRCLRRVSTVGERCRRHRLQNNQDQHSVSHDVGAEEWCPICLFGDTPNYDWLDLECQHRVHLQCIKGMNKLECPICRAPIEDGVLPGDVEVEIEKNADAYRQERDEEERRAIMQMIARERATSMARPPPQLEVITALRYIYDLGVPTSQIPTEIEIHIDPESPLPPPGVMFETTVRELVQSIRRNLVVEPEEDDSLCSSDDDSTCASDDQSDPPDTNPTIHRIRTIPIYASDIGASRERQARHSPLLFTASFNIPDLPPFSEDDMRDIEEMLFGVDVDSDDEE